MRNGYTNGLVCDFGGGVGPGVATGRAGVAPVAGVEVGASAAAVTRRGSAASPNAAAAAPQNVRRFGDVDMPACTQNPASEASPDQRHRVRGEVRRAKSEERKSSAFPPPCKLVGGGLDEAATGSAGPAFFVRFSSRVANPRGLGEATSNGRTSSFP